MADAVAQGERRVTSHTVDTGVVVLAATLFSQLRPDELWIAFGTGNSLRFVAICGIVASMTPKTCSSLLVFHAFTGCDSMSFFGGGGKKTAWETWKVSSEVTDAFLEATYMREISEKSASHSWNTLLL